MLHDFNSEFDTPTPGPEVLARRLETLLAGDEVVALLAGEPAVGLAVLSFRPNVWFDGPVALLDELYVRPGHRNRRIGHALLERACALARERGAEHFEINVDAGDTGARRFYESHGFSSGDPDSGDATCCYWRAP